MPGSNSEAASLTPEQSWDAIHSTMDRTRSSLYLAGTSTILLFWAAMISVGYLGEFWLQTAGAELAQSDPWIRGPLWGAVMVGGMVGSGFIGRRAASKNVSPETARSAGIRVFCFWLTVALAALFIPAAAGMWNAEAGPRVPHVAMGIACMGFILFGIMTRPELAAVGGGVGAAYYIPAFLAGDAAPAVTGVATLGVVVIGAAWLRRRGIH